MSEIDKKTLENNFELWRKERAPDLNKADAFERYSVEVVLRDADLADEEISAGIAGGDDDGGIDAMYFFVNQKLMRPETPIPTPALSAHLWIIQAKNEDGFGETPITKMEAFVRDLLSFSKPVSDFKIYSQKMKDLMSTFREKLEAILGQSLIFQFTFVYTTRSVTPPNLKVEERIKNLHSAVTGLFSSAEIDFQLWGATKLTEAIRTQPNTILLLDIVKDFRADDGSFVCLARIDKFAKFLTDDKTGEMRHYILEPNVRDYQGKGNSVNKGIREALASKETSEFWWLNNGITILAADCSVKAQKLEITSPELVNGLQTSHEIFNHFKTHKGAEDARTVLVRVIIPPNDQARRRIIKATNTQTPVDTLSLSANDDIQFDIEELFKLYEIFYDRRKGEYRRLRKPVSKIVSMRELAQTVIAIVLQKPNDARARPMTVLNTQDGRDRVFDVKAKRELFLTCVLIDRQIENYLQLSTLTKDVQADVRYYMDLWLACSLSQKSNPTTDELASLAVTVNKPIDVTILDGVRDIVLKIYNDNGADDRAAKGTEMANDLINLIQNTYPAN